MSKKKILLISIIGLILSTLSLFSHDLSSLCGAAQRECWSSFKDLKDIADPFIFLFPLIFFFSLLTYKMHEKVFRAWLRFAYWWVPLSIIVTLVLSLDTGGGFGMPNLLPAEGVAAFFGGVFFVVSLIIIIYKYLAMRGNPRR